MLDGLEGQVLAMILAAILICSTLIGSNRGLLMGVYSMIKNIIIVAAAVGMAPVIAKRLPETWLAREGIGYGIAFVVSVIVFNILGMLIKSAEDVPGLDGLNRFGGAVFGAVVGIFLIWTVLGVLGCFQEYDWCKQIVESVRNNTFVMWFQNTSPLPYILESFDFPVI